MSITSANITATYGALKNATTRYHTAGNTAIYLKASLEAARLTGLADGTIDGKNAELREASARVALADLYDALAGAEDSERAARLALDLARLDLEEMRAQLRLMELAAGKVEAL